MAGLTVTVHKAELLEKLKENREKHKESFTLAMKGYLIAQKKELEAMLEKLDAGEPVERYLSHNPPEDHTESYDEAIDMLEWETGDYIDLSQPQFVQYVRDDWGWKGNWSVSNSAYITAASASR